MYTQSNGGMHTLACHNLVTVIDLCSGDLNEPFHSSLGRFAGTVQGYIKDSLLVHLCVDSQLNARMLLNPPLGQAHNQGQ